MNKLNLNGKKKSQLLYVVSVVFLFFFILIESLHSNVAELDSLHHGLIFPAAVAVKDGLFPHLDAFAQYGPLNPLIQGLWLKVIGTRVFDLQLFTLVIATSISFLIFIICRRYFGKITSSLIALAWLSTGPHGLPWASLTTNFLILTALLLMISVTWSSFSKNICKILDAASGFILAIAIFGRIQTVLVAGSVLLVLFTISRRRMVNYLTGSLVGFLGFVIYLQINGALIPFIDECIIWSSQTLGYAEVKPLSKSLVFDMSWFFWTALFFALVIAWLNFLETRFYKLQILRFASIASLFMVFILCGIYSNLSLNELYANRGKVSLFNLEYFTLTASRKLLFSIDFAPLLIFLFIVTYLLIVRRMPFSSLQIETRLALAVGVPSISQLFPIADSYHTWWLSAILISCIAVCRREFETLNWQKQINIFLAALLVGLQVQSFINFNKPRYSFTNYTLSGMKSSLPTSQELDNTLSLLEKYVTPQSTRFICRDGIYSVSGGTYNSVDSNFVDWSSKSGSSNENYGYVFICYASQVTIDSYALKGWLPVVKVPFSTDPVSFNVLFRKAK
jgi:hypothetical protein